jgi:hypothetical protein
MGITVMRTITKIIAEFARVCVKYNLDSQSKLCIDTNRETEDAINVIDFVKQNVKNNFNYCNMYVK